MTEDIKKAYLKRGATIASVAAAFDMQESEVASLVAINNWAPLKFESENNTKRGPRVRVDWDAVEPHYSAGVLTLKQLGEQFGCSDAAIIKVARERGWTRDLSAKIKQKTADKINEVLVSEQLVSDGQPEVSELTEGGEKPKKARPTEAQIVEANAEVIALADLTNRKDVILGIDISRGHLEELAALSDPRFKDDLERLGDMFQDDRKAVETFRYIISLPGRIKMAKDAAASMGTYIPMQRKILKLDAEANKSLSDLDNLLAKINGTQ